MLIFDLGSNATKASLVLHHHIVRDWRVPTKIGKDVQSDGALSDSAFIRQCSAVELILSETAQLAGNRDSVLPIHALGTQALRKAPNSAKLVQMLEEKFALNLEIISGEQEAELEKVAVWSCEARLKHPDMRILTLDSGGSSTEFNLLEPDGTTIKQGSYPFGQHSIRRAVAQNLEMPFDKMLADMQELCSTYTPQILIAAGSSITTYAAYALKIESYCADKIESSLLSASVDVPRLDDAAVVGKCLFEAFSRSLKLPVYVTTRGIRHGWIALHDSSDC